MLALVVALAVSQSELTPPPPPPTDLQRSASLIAAELEVLDQELARTKLKPAWAPVVIGAGVASLCAAVAVSLAVSLSGGIVEAFLTFFGIGLLITAGAVVLLAGAIWSIAWAVKNGATEERIRSLQERIEVLKAERERLGARSEPWRSGLAEVAALTPVFAF